MKTLKNKINNFLFSTIGYKIVNQKERDKFNKFNIFNKIFSRFDKDKKLIFFDVGANKGQSTDFFINILKKNKIKDFEMHLFEPNQELVIELKKKFENSTIKVNQIGLSNLSQQKEFFHYKNNQKNSFYKLIKKNDGDSFLGSINCFTERLDDYASLNDIKNVNFLKIDCEGDEIEVLKGSKEFILNNKIDYIYIETSLGETYENNYLTLGKIENELKDNFELIAVENHCSGLDFKVQMLKRLAFSLVYKNQRIDSKDIFL